MKIKEQTRKLAAGCSKHGFEVADKADVVWRDFRRVLIEYDSALAIKKREPGDSLRFYFYKYLEGNLISPDYFVISANIFSIGNIA